MKILIVTGIYPPDIGGPATYVKTIEELLPAHGVAVSVLTFGEVRSLPKIIRHVIFFFKCFSRAYDTDIIFAQDPVSVGFPAMIVAKILRKRFFLRIGGDYAWEQGVLRYGVKETLSEFVTSKKPHHFFVSLFWRVERAVARAAEGVAVQSSYMKEIISQWGIHLNNITVIPNSFSGMIPDLEKGFLREKLGAEGVLAISAGRMVPWKEFDEIIEIVPAVLKKIPNFKLLLAGDGPDEKKLKEMVAREGLENNVVFLGRLSKDRLIEYLIAADVFVLNSTYEGFSHQILEAYAAGVPVVVTNVCGNPEAVEDGKSGILVSPHDRDALETAVLSIIMNTEFASDLTHSGREKLVEFSTERMVSATASFLGVGDGSKVE